MTDDEYRALQEQAHQVDELTRHPGWDVLLDYLRFGDAALAKRQIQVLQGAAKTYPDYLHRVGWIEGVQFAIDAPDRLRDVVNNETTRRSRREESLDG